MTVGNMLTEFYTENGIPENGGFEDESFEMKIFFLNFRLPDPKFRRDLTHVHDIQHILNDCDTSWKGEGFICGWEIATGFWKHFPIVLFILWAMGYSLWLHPKSVYNGFKKGLNNVGIVDLKVSKADFMSMEFEQLVAITKKDRITEMGFLQWTEFIFWSLMGQVVLLFPLIILLIIIIWAF